METAPLWIALVSAVILDFLIGDPRWLPHPIRWMGRGISRWEPRFRRWFRSPFTAGLFFAGALILATWTSAAVLVAAAGLVHPAAKLAVETIGIFYCLSARSLADEAAAVHGDLAAQRTASARKKLRFIVGRDVAGLTESGIARATVETVGENLVDGFIAPLFYAAIGGAPLALAFKMINTLDSMVGYKNVTYRWFGKTAARIDDAANFLPARLSVPVIATAAEILTGTGRRTWATAAAQGRCHSSPNAGYPEAAFAGALAVRLGGPGTYRGTRVEKPFIGTMFGAATPHHIRKSVDLMLLAALLWAAACCVTAAVFR